MTPPKLSRKIPSFSQNDFVKHSQRWLPKPQFWYPPLLDLSTGYPNTYLRIEVNLVSWLYTGWFFIFFCIGRQAFSDIFPRRVSGKLGSQHQLRIKTLPSVAFVSWRRCDSKRCDLGALKERGQRDLGIARQNSACLAAICDFVVLVILERFSTGGRRYGNLRR